MGKQYNSLLKFANRYSPGKPFTEATATKALSRWLYKGHGEKYLSLPVPEDGIGRSPDSKPFRFRCPDSSLKYARWLPFREHLSGDRKGLVSDTQTTTVPFIAVDIDRHSGDVLAEEHKRIVVEAGRCLCRKVPHMKWLAEVNPRNGSAKFFGFRRQGDQFSRSEAQKLASQLHQDLVHQGLCHNGNVEVFPDNCSAVFLPLRRDKVTIIDSGVLTRCTRKIKDVQFFPERVFEKIRCYSALNLLAWLYRGDNYDEAILVSALRHSCANLPDEEGLVDSSPQKPVIIALSPQGSGLGGPFPTKPVVVLTDHNTDEPNAFKRNWAALLPFARQFYKSNSRLPSTQEALSHLKANKLFSGRWEVNELNRRHRVMAILQKLQGTFDTSLLRSDRKIAFDHRIFQWCRRTFPHGLVARQKLINEVEMTSRVRVLRIPSRFVEHCVGVIAFCLENPLENNAVPVNRIKAIWNMVAAAPSWNQEYFKIVRSELERIGFVEIFDKAHESGKAWKWRKGPTFPGMKKRSSGMVSVSKRPSSEGAREKWGREEKNNRYNSLYYPAIANSQIGRLIKPLRDPPSIKSDHLATSVLRQVNKSEKIVMLEACTRMPCGLSLR